MPIGSKIIYRDKVSSTNTLAREMLDDDSCCEGTVIFASEQSQGKGQGNNIWLSEAGKNLLVSVITRPLFLKADQQFLISKTISLAIASMLDNYSASISIKWPNDIYYKDDKIAGILIENSLEGNKIKSSVIGAGININQASFPPGLPNPVSLSMINKTEYDIADMLTDFCRISDYWYDMLKAGQTSCINQMYISRLYRFDRPSFFKTDQGRARGRIKGIDKYGRLQVSWDNGGRGVYGFREIGFTDQYSPSR